MSDRSNPARSRAWTASPALSASLTVPTTRFVGYWMKWVLSVAAFIAMSLFNGLPSGVEPLMVTNEKVQEGYVFVGADTRATNNTAESEPPTLSRSRDTSLPATRVQKGSRGTERAESPRVC